MAKTCKYCKNKFEALNPISEPYVGVFCSYKCKYEYFSNGKIMIDRLTKFVRKAFKKNSGKVDKLKAGHYSVQDLYLLYLYFSMNRYPDDFKNYLVDEYDFPFLFIEVFELEKHVKLNTVIKDSHKVVSSYYVNQYHTIKEDYLPFGEKLYFISEDSNSYELFYDSDVDDEICENLVDKKESELEKLLVRTVNDKNGLCWKLAASSPGCAGVPDRLIVMPNNNIGFIEVKRPNGQGIVSKVQEKQLKKLSRLTSRVYILDDPKNIVSILKDIQFGSYPELRYGQR